ncbi:MAG: putative addiction module component [Candidatus Lokiarchaeum sp. GC14_75]|nr:MAG: putative addiction module component [Candidatus Lokiarchaeum sp. GC14_75]KKK40787.1 MAG: putative addiction module component [Candidatus Lokiarchaeum sp. GC14_75]
MSLDNFPDIIKLPTKDKILLVENLWNSIRSEIISNPIPESHKQELDQRQKTLNKNNLLSLEDLKNRFNK